MKHLYRLLVVAAYALASITAATLLAAFAVVNTGIAGVIGLFSFLCCIYAHGQIEISRGMRAQRRQLFDLAQAQQAIRMDADRAARELGDLSDAFDLIGGVSNRDVVNEMRVLEGLLQRLAPGGDRAPAPLAPALSVPASSDAAPKPQISLADLNVALEDNRIDLYLQPIVSLPQRKVRSHEGYSRLRHIDGSIIEPGQYIGVAEAAGIVSTIDNLLLLRCVQLIRRLHHRNRSAVIFCNISAHSLRDLSFFPQFVDFMEQNPDLAGSLIFEFSQAAVAGNTTLEWKQLARLAARGYRFSMDNVTHLDLDLAELASRKFGFIKVPAEILLNGMVKARSKFLSSDIKAALRRYGIDLIAEKVEDESTVVDLLDFELDFAQGYLFGEPRRSRGPEELSNPPVRQPEPLRAAG